jgi:PTS system galactitol-specific IIC component
MCVKLADWSVLRVEELSGLKGIAITTLSGLAYYPFALLIDNLVDRIPYVNKVKADPESIKNKLGFFGESMFIGFIMGLILGIFAKYPLKDVLELAISIAAVVYILPKVTAILSEGLMPISESMRKFMIRKFPAMENTYIGLDLAVIVGNPAVVVTGILLMPVALILAFTLPGVKFIPIGDLPNMIGLAALVVVATRGNIVRAILASIPIIIGKLYVASAMAATYTNMIKSTDFKIEGYSGMITGFLDGGNLIRFWVMKIFSGNWIAFLIIPAAIFLFYITFKDVKAKGKLSIKE